MDPGTIAGFIVFLWPIVLSFIIACVILSRWAFGTDDTRERIREESRDYVDQSYRHYRNMPWTYSLSVTALALIVGVLIIAWILRSAGVFE